MKLNWTQIFLVMVCVGSLTASGVLTLHLQSMYQQMESLNNTIAGHLQFTGERNANQPMIASTSTTCFSGVEQLKHELASIRTALDSQSNNNVGGSDSSHMHGHELIQRQEKVDQVLEAAIADGYWSAEDAEQFRNEAIALPAATVETLAADIIRQLESGSLDMPDDMMIPF